jgi:glyoxylase-like metal-dependent hydrolase (beta-lactamase superfamily II)
VVDANLTPSSARAVIASIRTITRKPVRYLINTHFHDDHVAGNQAFVAAYPGLDIIAHPLTRDDITGAGPTARAQFAKSLPGNVAYARSQMRAGKGFDDLPLTPRKREVLIADTLLANRFVAEVPSIRVTAPTITVSDRLVIERPGRTIEIRYLGRGHTEGDLVVFLREDGILAAGDLVGAPVPYAGTGFIAEWAETLERLGAMRPRVIVPGHGPVIRDTTTVPLLARALREVDGAVRRGVADSLSVQKIVAGTIMDETRNAFTHGDSGFDELWQMYFLSAAAQRSHLDHTGKLARRDIPTVPATGGD